MLTAEELAQITKSKSMSEAEAQKIIDASDIDAKKALAKRPDLTYEQYLRLIQDKALSIKDLSKRARKSDAAQLAIANGAFAESEYLGLDLQLAIAKSDDVAAKRVLARRRDLDRKTYDRLIITGIITPTDLLSRPNMRPQEQLTVSDCDLSESELSEFVNKPELVRDAWISLIRGEVLSTNDLLKRESLSPAGQAAVCLAGSHSDKISLLSRPDLCPQTVTLLADVGVFEQHDGTLTPQFKTLAMSEDFQVAFGKSYRKDILYYLVDMPNLCEKAFFAIANNHPLDPKYAPVKLELISRKDCPMEILAFYANTPQCLKRLDFSEDWDFKRFINIAVVSCGDGIPLPRESKSGEAVRLPLGPRWREYHNFKLSLTKSTYFKNEKSTVIPLWEYFTQTDRLMEMYDNNLDLSEMKIHIYSVDELLKELGYTQTHVRLVKKISQGKMQSFSVPDKFKKTCSPDGKYKVDGVYKLTKNGKVQYAVINQFETLDGEMRRDSENVDLIYYDIFADISAPNDMANAGYTMLMRYEKFQANPEEWRRNNYLNGISKYLKTTDAEEYNIFNKDRDAWIASHKGHLALDVDELKKTYCLLPEPTKPTEEDFSVCSLVNERPKSQQYSLLSTFEMWNPVFIGWSPKHFRILGPDATLDPTTSKVKIASPICTTSIKKGIDHVRE